MEAKEFTATAGGGAVEVVVSGTKEVLKVKLQEDVVDPDDPDNVVDPDDPDNPDDDDQGGDE